MDISETYIKMRRLAIPFLGMGNPPKFSCGAEVCWHTPFVCVDTKGDFYFSSKDETFQLERQDQLQEMLNDGEPDLPIGSVKLLCDWCRQHSDFAMDCTTREQLELGYLMSEKYNKTWNGEDWI